MLRICFSIAILIGFSNLGLAETSLLRTTIDVEIAGQSIATPLEFSGDQQGDMFVVSATVEISDLSVSSAAALQDEINLQGNCEQRWSAWDTQIGVTGRALSVASTIRVEQWACERLFGRDVTTRLGRETGRVEAHIAPLIEGGRPQLKLTNFRIHGLGAISRALGVEGRVRAELLKEIDKINTNPKLTEVPSLIGDSGYRYHQAEVRRGADGRAYLVASIIGPNDTLALAKLFSAIADVVK